MSLRVLVLSDTHIPTRTTDIPTAVMEAAESGPDLIVHAGDLVSGDVLRVLQERAPVHAVAGNMDPAELKQQLPRRREIDAGGLCLGVMHGDVLPAPRSNNDEDLARQFPDVDVVIVGHTHVPRLTSVGGVWIFNPGSPTDPRRGATRTFGWMEIEETELRFWVEAF